MSEPKRIPYQNTNVSPEKTQAEIQKLLYDYGAEAVQWTSASNGRLQLKFIMRTEGKPFTIRIDPPLLTVRKRSQGRYGRTETMVDAPASMRLLKWWLKSKFEAVTYGLVSVQEEFLAHIAGVLSSGEEVTVGAMIIPRLAEMPAEEFAKALPSGDKETP